jgi:hypothetical protein
MILFVSQWDLALKLRVNDTPAQGYLRQTEQMLKNLQTIDKSFKGDGQIMHLSI